MRPESSDARQLDSRRPSFCTKYEPIAAECEFGPPGGKYNKLILYFCLLGRYNS